MPSSPRMEPSPRSRTPAPSSPVAIMWDYENVRLPTGVSAFSAVSSLRTLSHSYGHLISAKAYMETSLERAPRQTNIRSELQSSGVSIIDTPHNGRKEVADQMICVDLMAFALDVKAPATIILLSGDKDFAYVLSTLRNRRYKVILVTMMSNISVSLTAQADEVLDWRRDVLNLQVSAPMVNPRVYSISGKPGIQKRLLDPTDASNQPPTKRVSLALQLPKTFPLPSKPLQTIIKPPLLPLPLAPKHPIVVIEIEDEEDDAEQLERERLEAKAARKVARKAAKAGLKAQSGREKGLEEGRKVVEEEEELREKRMKVETIVLSDEEEEVVVPSPGKSKGRHLDPMSDEEGNTTVEASNMSTTFSIDSPLSKPLLHTSTPLRRIPLADTPIRIIRPKRALKATLTLAQRIFNVPSTPVLLPPSLPALLPLKHLTSTPIPSTSTQSPSSSHSNERGDESIEILSYNDPAPSSDMDFGTPISSISYTLTLPPSLIAQRLFSNPPPPHKEEQEEEEEEEEKEEEEEDYIPVAPSSPAPSSNLDMFSPPPSKPSIAFNFPIKTTIAPSHKLQKMIPRALVSKNGGKEEKRGASWEDLRGRMGGMG